MYKNDVAEKLEEHPNFNSGSFSTGRKIRPNEVQRVRLANLHSSESKPTSQPMTRQGTSLNQTHHLTFKDTELNIRPMQISQMKVNEQVTPKKKITSKDA